MIPLVQPLFPSGKHVWDHFEPAVASGQISNHGACFNALTAKLNAITGRYCLPVVNGTVAIQIAVQSHYARGSRIACPDYTHVGTLQAIVAAGCTPVLIPASSVTWTADPFYLDLALSKCDGAVVVSPFGYPVNFRLYDQIARIAGKPIIYDLAGAWGIHLDTKATVCMSLHATKNFSCGEGGIVLFSRKKMHDDAKRLSNFDTLPDRSIASPYGGNHKPDELKCAIALAHLDDAALIDARITHKRNLIKFYSDTLGGSTPSMEGSAPSLCVINHQRAQTILAQAAINGFVSKQYYPLLSKMPGLNSVECMYQSSPAMQNCIALPSDVDEATAVKVAKYIKRILANY